MGNKPSSAAYLLVSGDIEPDEAKAEKLNLIAPDAPFLDKVLGQTATPAELIIFYHHRIQQKLDGFIFTEGKNIWPYPDAESKKKAIDDCIKIHRWFPAQVGMPKRLFMDEAPYQNWCAVLANDSALFQIHNQSKSLYLTPYYCGIAEYFWQQINRLENPTHPGFEKKINQLTDLMKQLFLNAFTCRLSRLSNPDQSYYQSSAYRFIHNMAFCLYRDAEENGRLESACRIASQAAAKIEITSSGLNKADYSELVRYLAPLQKIAQYNQPIPQRAKRAVKWHRLDAVQTIKLSEMPSHDIYRAFRLAVQNDDHLLAGDMGSSIDNFLDCYFKNLDELEAIPGLTNRQFWSNYHILRSNFIAGLNIVEQDAYYPRRATNMATMATAFYALPLNQLLEQHLIYTEDSRCWTEAYPQLSNHFKTPMVHSTAFWLMTTIDHSDTHGAIDVTNFPRKCLLHIHPEQNDSNLADEISAGAGTGIDPS